MTAFSAERAAAALMGARRALPSSRRLLASLPPGARPETMAEGIAAQVALAHLSDSAAPAGFKIGATAARMQHYLGLDGPAAGFMPRDGLHASGSTLSYDSFFNPGVECELAVHLAHDLPPGPCSQEQAGAAVDLLMTGIEIVERRYDDLAVLGTPTLVADQVFHAGAVLSTPVADWHYLDLASIHGEIVVNGMVAGGGTGGDLLGHPLAALAWLASSAEAAAFGGLRAGQVVMLGSVCPPIWLTGPADIEVRFSPLHAVTLELV
ncbi:MAG: 2-keto-4-pentenoate hydratase [Janthinobacterium lividum]